MATNLRIFFLLFFFLSVSCFSVPIAVPGRPSNGVIVDNRIYVSNTVAPYSIYIINGLTYEIIGNLPTLEYPIYSSVVNGKVAILNFNSDTISVIDGYSNQQFGIIDLKQFPLDDIAPYYSAAYANKIISTDFHKTSVSISNLKLIPPNDPFTPSHTPVETVVQVGDNIYPYVFGDKFFVNTLTNGYISVINAKTNQKLATLYLPNSFGMRAAVIRGDKIYVSVAGTHIKIIDTKLINYSLNPETLQTAPLIGQINVAVSAIPMNIIGNYLVGTGWEINGLFYAINLDTNQIYSYPVGKYTTIIGVKGSKVYVSSPYDNTITILDLRNIALGQSLFVKTISGDGSPNSGILYGEKLFICNYDNGYVSVLDTKTDTLIDTSLPQLLSFTTDSISSPITIKANFTQDLGPSTMTVRLNNQQVIVLDQVAGKSLNGTYTIGVNQNTPDLAIEEILSANITNLIGGVETNYKLPSSPGNLVAENSDIVRNLGDSANITIGNFRKINVGANPYGISAPVNLNGRTYVYVACQGAAIVQKVDTYTEQVVATYNVGQEPYGLKAVNFGGVTYIYIANTGSDTVSVINTVTGAVTTIPVGVKPYYVTATASKVYVSNSLTNDVSAIDIATQSVVASPYVGTYPRGVALHQFDLYVCNYGDLNYGGGNSISVINTVNNTNTITIPLPMNHVGSRGIALARNHYLFITDYLSNNVSLVNPHVNKVFPTPEDGQTNVPSSINVGKGPRGIIAVDSVNKVYVENFDEGTISVIDSYAFTELYKIKVGHSPSGLSLVGTKLYISSFQDNALYILDIGSDKLKVPILREGNIQYEFFDDYEFNKIERTTVFNNSGQILYSLSFDINGNALDLIVDNGATLNIPSIKIRSISIGNASVSFGPLTPDEQKFYSSIYLPPTPAPSLSLKTIQHRAQRAAIIKRVLDSRKIK